MNCKIIVFCNYLIIVLTGLGCISQPYEQIYVNILEDYPIGSKIEESLLVKSEQIWVDHSELILLNNLSRSEFRKEYYLLFYDSTKILTHIKFSPRSGINNIIKDTIYQFSEGAFNLLKGSRIHQLPSGYKIQFRTCGDGSIIYKRDKTITHATIIYNKKTSNQKYLKINYFFDDENNPLAKFDQEKIIPLNHVHYSENKIFEVYCNSQGQIIYDYYYCTEQQYDYIKKSNINLLLVK